MTDLQDKTLEELQQLIANAQTQLKIAQRGKHKEVIAQIRELADSIGVIVDIHENSDKAASKKVSAKVAIKYQNPDDPSKTWTGRGMKPKWLVELMNAGRDQNDFLIG